MKERNKKTNEVKQVENIKRKDNDENKDELFTGDLVINHYGNACAKRDNSVLFILMLF